MYLLSLVSYQFLHGGWLHLIGNMVFLWVFGRAVEDRLGHALYAVLYFVGGAFAGLVQSVLAPDPGITLVGASGSTAAVLGAYLVFFPGAWVSVLVPVFFFFWTFDLPAALVLVVWFVGQFFTGVASITDAAAAGNVAVWAHVAGFALGAVAALVLPRSATAAPARRAGGPGPARLVSSLADLVALALALRIVLRFLEVRPGGAPIGQIASLVYRVTGPVIAPFERVVPTLLVAGRPIDTAALALLVLVYLLVGVLASRRVAG